MKIEEAIEKLNMELEKEYGRRDIVKKITVNEDFDMIAIELFKSDRRGFYSYKPSGCNDLVVCGVRIEAREQT